VLGFNASYHINSLTYLQAVLIPKGAVTPYPDAYLKDSYLAEYSSFNPAPGSPIENINLFYYSSNVVWGLRLSHSFPSFDAGISYYRGSYMNPFPVDLQVNPTSNGQYLDLTLGYPSKQVFGLEFQGKFPGIEGAILRGDLAYIIPEHWSFQGENLLDTPYFQGIISADYTTDSNLYLNGGFIYVLPFERGRDCSPYIYLNTNKTLNSFDFEPFYIGILSLYDISMGNIIGVDYQISDRVSTSLSYLFLSGNSDSKLGIMKNSQGLYFSIKWLL
jgi:hypothetical protein